MLTIQEFTGTGCFPAGNLYCTCLSQLLGYVAIQVLIILPSVPLNFSVKQFLSGWYNSGIRYFLSDTTHNHCIRVDIKEAPGSFTISRETESAKKESAVCLLKCVP